MFLLFSGPWGVAGKCKGVGVYLENGGDENKLVVMSQKSDEYIFNKHPIVLKVC